LPNNKNILIISNEPWGDVWYSKHNYAFELSKRNKIFFINPAPGWNLFSIFKAISKSKIDANLYVVNYWNFLPSANNFLFKLNNRIVSFRLKKYLQKEKFENFIFWTFDPYRLYSPKQIGASKSIFHVVDNYQFNHRGEIETSENCDYIICVSDQISKNYLPFQKRILTLPHAISIDEFRVDYQPIDVPASYGLYVGNIDKRIDYEQLEKIILSIKEIDFVFVGKLSFDTQNVAANRIFTEKKYNNVKHLGVKKFKDLKNYIAHSTFCFAIMDDKFHGNRIAHHKIFQYLAFGKPVFSSVFSDYTKIKNYLYMEDGIGLMIHNIQKFIQHGEDEALKKERIAIAKEHTFDAAIKKIDEFINE
jgi:hypothetical protein